MKLFCMDFRPLPYFDRSSGRERRREESAHDVVLQPLCGDETNRAMRARRPQSVAELFELHESLATQAKELYDRNDATLEKLVLSWKKIKAARVDEKHVLEIEDTWRGKMKALRPGAFSHLVANFG